VRLGFSTRGSKAWTLSSHWDTTWAKIWLGLQSKMYGFFHFLYKRKQLTVTIIKRKWRLYQATEVVPSCVSRGTCIPNMLPWRPISGGSVLNGQAELDAGIELGFSSRSSKAWTLSSHWDTTWLVARSFMAFLVFEYLMLVSLGT
jgi:hypothetical protein